ncbi:MAG TPA: biotin--[acetyl-CoA-carboxylase] ligase [Bacteroidia bacterium]|jgi:BirA family biotin operon repressor/biotin-[acetyl-CoA-carboxylase] ligase|nr:biotin--[acetyl-CoA-carboxylase] ligase [Bacteroidia bacterium]
MNTLFTGRHIIELDEIPSTNTYAMGLLKQGNLTEGTLIKAIYQTEGRGQYGNNWQAEKGKNLTFSLVMQPLFLAAEKQFYLSKITSLAVLGMLTEFLPMSQYDITIKWPNDVLVNGQKIAGILIENILPASSGGNRLQNSIIGVGININQADFNLTKRAATSLGIILKKELDLTPVLERFCKHFEALYLSLKQNRLEQINKQYLPNLYQYNLPANYHAEGKNFGAKIIAVEENGLLVLETEEGEHFSFNFKEVEFL